MGTDALDSTTAPRSHPLSYSPICTSVLTRLPQALIHKGKPLTPRRSKSILRTFMKISLKNSASLEKLRPLTYVITLQITWLGMSMHNSRRRTRQLLLFRLCKVDSIPERPIIADFSPVTDFREATCRQFEEDSCNRGGYCNFMHVKQIGRELRRKLFGRYRKFQGRRSRSRSRSRSPRRREHRENGDYRGRGRRSGDNHGRYDGNGGRRQHGSPRRARSPIREGSEERRARIEQWNREKEEKHE
ncbi:splicing factor U2af small subunit B-like [Iris pallida]|uniref:Splicing factor U2af small subunit B-like n=1 Tax=Iris pallida TaxID=29817 RepID=A0AAX6GKF3_IRIPA|nr:splicing factor U2af small subunit B-like [Iris pallida]